MEVIHLLIIGQAVSVAVDVVRIAPERFLAPVGDQVPVVVVVLEKKNADTETHRHHVIVRLLRLIRMRSASFDIFNGEELFVEGVEIAREQHFVLDLAAQRDALREVDVQARTDRDGYRTREVRFRTHAGSVAAVILRVVHCDTGADKSVKIEHRPLNRRNLQRELKRREFSETFFFRITELKLVKLRIHHGGAPLVRRLAVIDAKPGGEERTDGIHRAHRQHAGIVHRREIPKIAVDPASNPECEQTLRIARPVDVIQHALLRTRLRDKQDHPGNHQEQCAENESDCGAIFHDTPDGRVGLTEHVSLTTCEYEFLLNQTYEFPLTFPTIFAIRC